MSKKLIFNSLIFLGIIIISINCASKNDSDKGEFNIDNIPIKAKLFFLKGESSNEGEYPGTIYIVDSQTKEISKLLDEIFDKKCGNFDISRDGLKIVFASTKDGNWDIWTADLDLNNNRALNPVNKIKSSLREEDPKLSYNGEKIVYKKDNNIFIYDLNNSNDQIITSTDEEEWAPVFSSDDKYIAFGRGTDKDNPHGDIILYNLENSTEKVVSSNQYHDWFPAFNYDGDLIFVSQKETGCNDDIYMIKKENLEKPNPYEYYSRITSLNECNSVSDADPSIVYGMNNYLVFVSDRYRIPGKYGIYIYSFIEQQAYLLISHDQNRLLGPIICTITPTILTLDSTPASSYNSIAIDSADKVHISYYDNPNSDLKYATNVSGSWVYNTLDSVGLVGSVNSIAIDSADKVHISYHDNTNNDLKYATNKSGSWVYTTLDSDGLVGKSTSIAIDSADKVHISYRDYTNFDLKYATNKSGSWVYNTLDSVGMVGAFTSIAIDSADKVHISYYDDTNDDLKYATNKSGSWVYNTLDSTPAGSYNSIAIDSADKVHISYRDLTNGDLKYATNANGSWVYTTLDYAGGLVGWHTPTSIAIDSADKVHISYYDDTNEDLKYAINASGSWLHITLDSVGMVGWYTSIAIDSADKVHISYHDLTNEDLKYATW